MLLVSIKKRVHTLPSPSHTTTNYDENRATQDIGNWATSLLDMIVFPLRPLCLPKCQSTMKQGMTVQFKLKSCFVLFKWDLKNNKIQQ